MSKINKNISSPINYKSISGLVDKQLQRRVVSGYFAAFNNIDSDMDIIRPGAFAKSISERGINSTGNRKIKYLHQHRIDEISGVLLRLEEDDYGLLFEGRVEETPLGDIILERYANGTYNEHSIGFRYVREKCEWIEMPMPAEMLEEGQDPKSMMPVFECKELNLFEGSVVTFGANSETPFTGFKGTHDDLEKMLNDELEFLIRKAPNYEFEFKMRQLWKEQLSLAKSLAEKSLKEESKPKFEAVKHFDYNYLNNNLLINL